MRYFSSLRGGWEEGTMVSSEELKNGIPVQLDRKGFCVFELRQVV